MSTSQFDRREFLKLFAAGSGCYALMASPLPFASSLSQARAEPGLYHFPQGLASGDPKPDAILLWTRVEKIEGATGLAAQPHGGAIDVYVQLAEDPDFNKLVIERGVRALPQSDHTVKVFIRGLKPDTVYYYRFFAGSDTSSYAGRTRTAPRANTLRKTRFAVVSCQNYENGYYGAYRRLVIDDINAKPEDQIDFVLHLGDFIYERVGDVPLDKTPTRIVPPLPDGSTPWVPDGTHPWWQKGSQAAVSVADYRHLYKTYLMDPDLQSARARFPFIHTWDDHEFTNDCWQANETYFGNGQPAQSRKRAANKSWFEFIPALLSSAPDFHEVDNEAHDFKDLKVETAPLGSPDENYLYQDENTLKAIDSITIYRAFAWGQMLDLVITDLRSYRSPPVITDEVRALIKGAPVPPVRIINLLDAGRTANEGKPPATLTYGENEIANPRAAMPQGTHLGAAQKEWFKKALESSTAKWRIWASSVPALSMRLDFSRLPFAGLEDGYVGTDAWQGYPGELSELMAHIHEKKIGNVVTLSGDYHAFAAGRLPVNPDAEKKTYASVEFMTTGISSSTMYAGAESSARSSAFFHRAVEIEIEGTKYENFNNTLVNGLRESLMQSYTGTPSVSEIFRNENTSPGLSYFDSKSNGFSIVTLNENAMQVELVNIGDISRDAGPLGPKRLRRTHFNVPAWAGGEEPRIEGPSFEGEPSFPYMKPTT